MRTLLIKAIDILNIDISLYKLLCSRDKIKIEITKEKLEKIYTLCFYYDLLLSNTGKLGYDTLLEYFDFSFRVYKIKIILDDI